MSPEQRAELRALADAAPENPLNATYDMRTNAQADRAVISFAQSILHGDDHHREWLLEAAYAWIEGTAIPSPRGSGNTEAALTKAREDMRERCAGVALAQSDNPEALSDYLPDHRTLYIEGCRDVWEAIRALPTTEAGHEG